MANLNFLSKDSLKLLKHFSKVTSISPPESNNLSEDCLYQLHDFGFIDFSSQTIDIDTMSCEYTYTITESGKGYLHHIKNESLKKWVPYGITTTLSVFALLKSYGHGIDDIILWCMQQLMQLSK